MGGDFYAIVSSQEKKGGDELTTRRRSMEEFKDFINGALLLDAGYDGAKLFCLSSRYTLVRNPRSTYETPEQAVGEGHPPPNATHNVTAAGYRQIPPYD